MFNFSTFNDLLSLHKFNKNSPDNVYLIYIYKIYINQYGIFAFFFPGKHVYIYSGGYFQ